MISLLHCCIHRKFGRYNNTYQIDGHQQVRVVIVPPGELSNRAGNYIINIAKRKDIMIPHNKLWWIHIFFLSILNLSALFYWHSYLEETVCDLYVCIYLHSFVVSFNHTFCMKVIKIPSHFYASYPIICQQVF